MHPNDHLKLIIGDLVMQNAALRAETEALREKAKEAETMPNSKQVPEPDHAAIAKAAETEIQHENFAALKRMREAGAISDAEWAQQAADPAFSAWLEGNG